MKIRHSSKSFKSNPPKDTMASSSDNMLFSPGELKQIYHDEKRPRIIKIVISCLLVAIIGTTVYALQGKMNTSSVTSSVGTSSGQSFAPASTNKSTSPTPTDNNNASSLQAQANANQQDINTQNGQSKNEASATQSVANTKNPNQSTTTAATGCQQNSQAFAQMNQIGVQQNQIAAQMSQIGDEETKHAAESWDASSGISFQQWLVDYNNLSQQYSNQLESLQQEAASLQQQYDIAEAQLEKCQP